MKRLLSLSLAAAALAPVAEAQYYDDRPEPTGRPILDRLRADIHMLRGELDRGFYEVRHELRRSFTGRPFRMEGFGSHTESPPYRPHDREPSYRADESFGRFSEETLQRHRHPAPGPRPERHFEPDPGAGSEVRRERDRELAERTAPQWSRRPAENGQRHSEHDAAEHPAPAAPQPGPLPFELSPDQAPDVPLDKDPVDPVTLPEPPARDDAPDRRFSEAEKRNFPLATKTDRPGIVRSPYPPFDMLDVTGIAPGDLAMEPEGERVFRVPE